MDTLPEKEKEEEEGSSSYSLPHPVWTKEELENVTITHNVPQTKVDKVRREREGGEGGTGGEGGEESDREREEKEKSMNCIRTNRVRHVKPKSWYSKLIYFFQVYNRTCIQFSWLLELQFCSTSLVYQYQ